MPRRRKSVAPLDASQVFSDRMDTIEKAIRTMAQAQAASVQVVDTENFNDPVEGMVVVDWPTSRLCYYHDNRWICTPENPVHAIKVYTDKTANKVGDGAFRFPIEEDLAELDIIAVRGFNGVVGTGPTVIQISNQTRGIDILSTPITIDAGEISSKTAGTPPVIRTDGATPANHVHEDDVIWIDVDTVGSGSKGLGVYITFAIPLVSNAS